MGWSDNVTLREALQVAALAARLLFTAASLLTYARDRQTDTDRQTDCNTLHPTGVKVTVR